MAFELYHYQVLYSISKINPIQFNQFDLGLEESYLRSVLNEVISLGYAEQVNNKFSITDNGEKYLKENDKNPEGKELRILILEYLKNQKAYAQKIDVVVPFLHEAAPYEQRLELSQTLGYLEKQEYIELNNRVENLTGKQSGRFTGIYQMGIKASITEKGERVIEPPKEPVSPIHHIHMENVHNPIVNSSINQSDLSNNENSFNTETTTKTIEKNKPTKLIIEKLYWIAGIIVGLIAIYEFLHSIHFVLKL